LVVALYSKNLLFDYATQYSKNHKTIAPAKTFSLTETEFNQFLKWLENKDYSYQTMSEIVIDSAIAIAKEEKYYDDAKLEFENLKKKLSHDKKQDLLKNKSEVKEVLENEIASRYYFFKGRIETAMQNDEDLKTALSVINDSAKYRNILSKK